MLRAFAPWPAGTPPRTPARALGLTALCLVLLSGCGHLRGAREPSLYARLGGQPVIDAVVSDLLDGFAASPDGRRSFERVRLPRVKRLLGELLCVLTGGPCTYSGDGIARTHAGLGITEREFAALVQALRDTLDRHAVGTREKNELLRLLAPMKRDIVTAGRGTVHGPA